MPATVGVIANPASGRDIRRLVAGASVFDNAEKGSMVFRAMAGLGEAGVERVLMMPAADGVGAALERQLSGRCGALAEAPFPVLEVLGQASTGTAQDTVAAVREMVARDVAAIVVLGGDGTHRLVAAHCGDIPLLALSTGTNNAFPEMREATVAGLAAGLVATGAAPADGTVVREHGLEVSTNGRRELALVDVAVSTERFVGSRALWKAGSVSELFVAFAGPSAIGLSAIAGILDPVARGEGEALHVRLAPPGEAARTVRVPLAPGLIAPVGIRDHRRIAAGETVALPSAAGCLALDGEREIERSEAEAATVRVVPGPRRIDVDAVMRLTRAAAT